MEKFHTEGVLAVFAAASRCATDRLRDDDLVAGGEASLAGGGKAG